MRRAVGDGYVLLDLVRLHGRAGAEVPHAPLWARVGREEKGILRLVRRAVIGAFPAVDSGHAVAQRRVWRMGRRTGVRVRGAVLLVV